MTVHVTKSMTDFEKIIEESFFNVTKVSTVGSVYNTICYIDHIAPGTKCTKIYFVAEWDTMSEFQVSEKHKFLRKW